MKNVGRCQAHQITPSMRAATSGRRRLSIRGSETAPPELLAQQAGIVDESEGQEGEEPAPRVKALDRRL
jgi:hypothetical protein